LEGGENLEKVVRTFRVNLEAWKSLKDLADRLGVSRGELLRKAIDWLLTNPTFAELVREGIA